jgi:molecular chaperone DnaK
MRVGIDFGTTHTVAAVVDCGNYLVASFDGVDTLPSLIAANASGAQRFLMLGAFTHAAWR